MTFTYLSRRERPSMPDYKNLECMCWSQDHWMVDAGAQHLPSRIWEIISLALLGKEACLTLCLWRTSLQLHR